MPLNPLSSESPPLEGNPRPEESSRVAPPGAGSLAGAKKIGKSRGPTEKVAGRRFKDVWDGFTERLSFRRFSRLGRSTDEVQRSRADSPSSGSLTFRARAGQMLTTVRLAVRGFFKLSSGGKEISETRVIPQPSQTEHGNPQESPSSGGMTRAEEPKAAPFGQEISEARVIPRPPQTEHENPQEFPFMMETLQEIDPEMTSEQRNAVESAYKKEYKEACRSLASRRIPEALVVKIAHGIATRSAVSALAETSFNLRLSSPEERLAGLTPPQRGRQRYFVLLARVLAKNGLADMKEYIADKDVRDVAMKLFEVYGSLVEFAMRKGFDEESAEEFADASSKYLLNHWDESKTNVPLLIECSTVYANEHFAALDKGMSEEKAAEQAGFYTERYQEGRKTLNFSAPEAEVYMAAYSYAESSTDASIKAMKGEQRQFYNKSFAIGCVLAKRQDPPITHFDQRCAFGRSYALAIDQYKLDKKHSKDSDEMEFCATEFARACAQRCPKSELGDDVEVFMGGLDDVAKRFIDIFNSEKASLVVASPEMAPQDQSKRAVESALQKLWESV